jgi:hypothetical protein
MLFHHTFIFLSSQPHHNIAPLAATARPTKIVRETTLEAAPLPLPPDLFQSNSVGSDKRHLGASRILP